MNNLERFKKSGATYSEIAVALDICEMSARNKLSGKSRVTKLEQEKLDQIFKEKEEKQNGSNR